MFNIPNGVCDIMNKLIGSNYTAYLVGGCVRDHVLGIEPNDFDICTSALPDSILCLFPGAIPTGIKHGTLTVLSDSGPVEVSAMRCKGGYTDNLHLDLAFRDFTINSLAMDINGVIYDYNSGIEDIKSGIIRTTGPARNVYRNDPLRMMRAVRLACHLGFYISSDTTDEIMLSSSLITSVSAERVRDELNRIILSIRPSFGIRRLFDYGLLTHILPELCVCHGFEQNSKYHNKDVFEHTMDVVESTPDSLALRLSALLHDIGKPLTYSEDHDGQGHFYKHHMVGADMCQSILKRLKYDNDTINRVSLLVREHMSRYFDLRRSGIKRFIARVGVKNLDNLFELQIADIKGGIEPERYYEVIEFRNNVYDVLDKAEPLSVVDLDINGHDLQEIGIQAGKEMWVILNALLDAVLENPDLNDNAVLLDIVRNRDLL